MKIGLYAGTFDPIHDGHIGFALESIKTGSLDKVIIVAEKEPYRKKPVASWDHRQAMIERATEPIHQIDHDYAFAAQLSHSHTMRDMLLAAKMHYGQDNQFWFLFSSDVFEHVHQWNDVVSENDYGGFIVALRDNHTSEWLDQKLERLKNIIPIGSIMVIESTHPRISSGGIRENIKQSQTSSNLPNNVLSYAIKHNIYA